MDGTIRVLHVDDEPNFADMAAGFVEREDDRITVNTATSASEGLEYLAEHDVDCIVSDYDMPGRNGIEFLEAVREEHPDLPFILFTGKGSEEVASEAISAGVTDYLQKESGTERYELLTNRITNAIAQHRAQRRATEQERTLTILRDVNQALVAASSREEIESAVTDILSTAEPYVRVWLGEYEADWNRLVPRAVAGVDGDAATPISLADESADDGVVTEAIRTGELTTTRERDPTLEVWADEASSIAYEAAAVMPIVYHGERHGVLALYAERAAFDAAERAMLDEIADDVAQALDAAETRRVLERHRTAVESVPEGVFILDEDGTILLTNERAAALGDRAPEEIQGEGFPTLVEAGVFEEEIVDWYLDSVREMLSSSSDREDARFETTVHPPDGEPLPVEVHLTLRPYEEEYRGTVGIIRDVTERMARERELERQNERLEAFADVVSHDLRAPLNVADAHLEMAQEECASEYLADVAHAHDRMDALIDDLLTFARACSTEIEEESVALGELAERCWQAGAPPDATLVVDVHRSIRADRDRVRRLLENLLGNALEFGDDDVTVTVGELDGAGFFVADDGPGIPAGDRETVFERGYSTTEAGSGLGLSIVEEIADAHGWTIEVTDSDDGGARFEITGVEFGQ